MSKSNVIVLDQTFANNLEKGYDEVLSETFLNLKHHESEFSGIKTLYVSFQIQKKTWDEYRKHGLGSLYGIDLSNYLYRRGIINSYAVPTVNDKKHAQKGIKTILVQYHFGERR